MAAKHIEAAWLSYRRDVVPNDADAVQITESRRAFYAGAQTLFSLVMANVSSDAEPTDADLQFMEDVTEELQQFPNEVRSGRA